VSAWIADDPDPACQVELRQLLDRGELDELRERFSGGLSFGTAGLRGRMRAGPTGINRATVRRATAGLAAYLLESTPEAPQAGVVIGYDARHGSPELARETAGVLTGAGLRVLRLPGRLPTPVLAFAVRHLGAAAGVMVTASHLPAADNGYKVYFADGAPIVPPADADISAHIDQVNNLVDVPLGRGGEEVGDSLIQAYLEAITGSLPPGDARDLRVLYTPLHGVGRDVLLAAFERAGFSAPRVVSAQADPDPDFPTVARPNPEEPGTLDLALKEAARADVDILLANDPDADRLAAAIRDRSGGWRTLSGDEIGTLLGDYLLRRTADVEHALVVTTVASSTWLQQIADHLGARYAETLTGFKWIMHAQDGIADVRFRFGYEEALGYAVNDIVRDKDGISAALALASLAAEAKRDGRDLSECLDDLAMRVGLHATGHWSLELLGSSGRARLQEIMATLRASPPETLNGRRVTAVDDLASGMRRGADGRQESLPLPRSDVLILRCQDSLRAVIRPSGTEPKLKAYLQVIVPVNERDVAAARREAARQLEKLRDELGSLTQS